MLTRSLVLLLATFAAAPAFAASDVTPNFNAPSSTAVDVSGS